MIDTSSQPTSYSFVNTLDPSSSYGSPGRAHLLEVACSEMVDAHAASAHVLTACEEESVVAAHPVPESLVAIDGEKEAGNAFERTFVGGSVVMGHPALDTLDCRAHESAVQAE